ncbi:MAG: carboxypeptidase-like regulatory domain-containing protein [Capsulimonadales bacterium]|nr:carboxypeptidase-like regulatory domain-containing protein [Capsulimonadales bacterium]
MQRWNFRAGILPFLLPVLCAGLALLPTGCGGGGGGGGSQGNTVRGIVRDSLQSDAEVQDATVTIGGVSTRTRTVDNANAQNPVGSFELRNVPVGTSTATIALPGGGGNQTFAFQPAVTAGTNPNLEFIVNIGQISGRVVRANGQPAANAFVTVSATAETFQTNADGTFLATLVPKGNTEIFAVEGTSSHRRTVAVEYGNTAIGDVTLADDPNPNPPGHPYTLFGQVTVTDVGTPAGTIVLLFRNGVQVESTFTDSSGLYYFYVPVGSYTIQAVRNGFQTTTAGPVTLSDASQGLRTDLTMVP